MTDSLWCKMRRINCQKEEFCWNKNMRTTKTNNRISFPTTNTTHNNKNCVPQESLNPSNPHKNLSPFISSKRPAQLSSHNKSKLRRINKTKYLVTFTCYLLFTLLMESEFRKQVNAGTLEDLVTLDRLLKENYDRRATPTNHLNNTTPTKVWCELFVRSFGSPNPLTMDYKVDLYLRQQWVDERLKHRDIKRPMDLNDPNLVKAIWKPEVYFPNAKDADFQFVTVPNVLVRIHPEGTILYMLRLKITFSCMMDLSKFPLDRQTCTMEVASFSKTVEELILEWKVENPITTGSLQMTQFAMVNIVAAKCHESFQIGNYSCLVAEFHLARLLGFHLVQSYLPTILMVVISWVSFWMDVNSVPGRVTLGITTLLTVSSKATTVQENIESSYVKAIDVWMGACTAFVFLALMEFTVVNYLWRKEQQQHAHTSHPHDHHPNAPSGSSHHHPLTRSALNLTCNLGLDQTSEPLRRQHYNLRGEVDSLSMRGQLSGEGVISASPTSSPGKPKGDGGDWGEPRFVDGSSTPMNPRGKGNDKEEHSGSDGDHSSDNSKGDGKKNYEQVAKKIDECCRFIFPISFTLFIIFYWAFYLFI